MEAGSPRAKHAEPGTVGGRTPAARHPLQKPYGQHRHFQPNGSFHLPHHVSPAEMERELIVERTRAGLAAAREKGRIGGRRPKLTPEQWTQAGRLIANGVDRKQVAIIYDVAVCTLYKKFPAR